MTENGNISTLECRQPDNRIDSRRLAGAIGSEKSKKLARCNVERKIVDGGEGFVSFGKVPDRNGAGSAVANSRSPSSFLLLRLPSSVDPRVAQT
jgi:hypothetical protein